MTTEEPPSIAALEALVNERWGKEQWDWTIGKCPEGWFYYCGTHIDPDGRQQFKHKGYAPSLAAVLWEMISIQDVDNAG